MAVKPITLKEAAKAKYLRLRLNWEVFKEEWPYLRRRPIQSILRWNNNRRNRPALHKMLNERAYIVGICRLHGETDEQLRKRLLGQC